MIVVKSGERRIRTEADTWDITDGLALPTETRDQDLIVLIDVGQDTISRDEGRDPLGILDELNTNTLPDSRVRLLGLNAHLLDDNPLGVRGTVERVSLAGSAKVELLVDLGGPPLLTAPVAKSTGSVDSTRFSN